MPRTQAQIALAIATDLDLCDLGLLLTTGATRARYAAHRKACFTEIRRMNTTDGLDGMTDDELLDQLRA